MSLYQKENNEYNQDITGIDAPTEVDETSLQNTGHNNNVAVDNKNCHDKDQTSWSNLDGDKSNEHEEFEEAKQMSYEGWVHIPYQTEEGGGDSGHLGMADIQDNETHATNPAISNQAASNEFIHVSSQSIGEENESNYVETLNRNGNTTGYEKPLVYSYENQGTFNGHEHLEDASGSTIRTASSDETDMNDSIQPDEDLTLSMDIDDDSLSDSCDARSSVDETYYTLLQSILYANIQLNARLEHQAIFANKLHAENTSNLENISRSHQEIVCLRSQVQQLNQYCESLKTHIKQLQCELGEKTSQLNSSENENVTIKSADFVWSNDMVSISVRSLSTERQLKDDEPQPYPWWCVGFGVMELVNLARENAQIKDTVKKQEKELKKQRQENGDLQKSLNKINQKFEVQNSQTEEFKTIINSWKSFYTENHNKWEQKLALMNAELDRYKVQIQNTKEEHANLLMRYSKLAGESLAMGNVNIADLSDPNRPTKLAEQFSELYDNDWTDAFEELARFEDEEEKIMFLLKILKRAYELSLEMTATCWLTRCYYTTHEEYVHTGTDTYGMMNDKAINTEEATDMETNVQDGVDSSPAHGESDTETVTEALGCQMDQSNETEPLKEIETNGETEEQSKMTPCKLADTGTVTESLRCQVGQSNEAEPLNDDEIETNGENEEQSKVTPADLAFQKLLNKEKIEANGEAEEQSRLTPTPANLADTETVTEALGCQMDQSGETTVAETFIHKKLNVLEIPDNTVDLNEREQGAVKWFPHVRKKILSSQSEFVTMETKKCLLKEFKINGQDAGGTTKLLDYVTKCCGICLLMCTKEPPLYINFQTDKTDPENFNNEQYKAYTKRGTHIKYIVWPCLFLEKNGAILAKGIAQGEN